MDNTVRDLLNSSYPTKPHSLIAKYRHHHLFIIREFQLSSDVFDCDRRTSTGRELFSLLICLEATKFVLLCVFILKETIFPRICLKKTRQKSKKGPLPADERRSKASLVKRLIDCF